MVKVSIILPVYNVEKYLRQCIDSIINQTFKDIEIIIINDCSQDNSLQIIKEYQKKDNRIILLNLKRNVGLGFARNEGIKISKGKYITFIDSDDWVKNNYIEILFNNIEKYKCDIFVESFSIYNNIDKTYTNYKYPNFIRKYKKHKNLLLLPIKICCACSKIYSKEYLTTNKLLFKLKNREDILFFYEIILTSPKIIFDSQPIYFYRINRNDSLTTNTYFILPAILKLLKKINNLLINKNCYKEYMNVFYIYSFLEISYGLTCCKLSKKRTKYALLIIKRFLFKKHSNNTLSNKVIIFIFKIFLNHCLLYKITALFLKKIKRILLTKFY